MDIQSLDCWNSLLRAVPLAALVVVVSHFLGSGLLAWTHFSKSSASGSWSSFHLASILGLNVLGLFALLISGLPLFIKLLLELGICLPAIYAAARSCAWRMPPTKRPGERWNWRKLIIALPLAFTLGPALAYPSGWDELTYHLELPRRWVETGWMSVHSDLPYSALPSLLEAIFTLTYPAESLITPRLLVWIVWCQGLFVFRDACVQVCNHANANCLALALSASPAALLISANCYVEALIWANVACLLYLTVTRPLAAQIQWRMAGLLGIFIGGAIAIKMTSIGLLCLPIILAMLSVERSQLTRREALTAIAVAVVFASPFYLRTWLLTGNPVAPFFAQWFTNDPAWLACSRYHHELAVSNFGIRGVPGFVIGPGALAFANELYDGRLGWQWLLMLLLLTVAIVRTAKQTRDQRQRPLVWLCVATAILLYALWFMTSQQVRFAIPLVMVVVLAAGIGIESYHAAMQRWWRIALVALSLASIPWTNTGYYLDSWLCVLKVRAPIDYIRDGVTDSYTELALYLHEQIPQSAKVISLFEHRLFYLPSDVEIATPYFQVKHFPHPEIQTPENLMAELREQGIQYVVLTTNPLGPDVSSASIEKQQAWFHNVDRCIDSGQLKVIWKSEFHGIAQVSASEP